MSLSERHLEIAREVDRFESMLRDRYGDRLPAAEAAAAGPEAAGFPDDLLVVGFVGGTGVGKSTLLDALAGSRISAPGHRRPTTDRVVAYVHAGRRADIENLPFLAGLLAEETPPHHSENARSLVLLDLPDIDSIEGRHAEVVLAILPHLDVVVWTTSVTKYRDRAFHGLLRSEAARKAAGNFVFVLNKLDEAGELGGAGAPAEVCERFRSAAAESLGATPGRLFGISAHAALTGSGDAFDYAGLRETLLARRDEQELRSIRNANRRARLRTRLRDLARRLRLESREGLLASMVTTARDALEGPVMAGAVGRDLLALAEDPEVCGRLARTLRARRLAAWPILRHVAPLTAPLGRLLALAGRGAPRPAEALPGGTSAVAEVLSEAAHGARLLRFRSVEPASVLVPDRPTAGDVTSAAGAAAEAAGARLREAVAGAERRAAATTASGRRLRLAAVLLPLFWFPIVQPILEEALSPGGTLGSALRRTLFVIIREAGALGLLRSGFVVLGVWVVMAAIVAARASGRAAAVLTEAAADPASASAMAEAGRCALLLPLLEEQTRIAAEREELRRLEAEVEGLTGRGGS